MLGVAAFFSVVFFGAAVILLEVIQSRSIEREVREYRRRLDAERAAAETQFVESAVCFQRPELEGYKPTHSERFERHEMGAFLATASAEDRIRANVSGW